MHLPDNSQCRSSSREDLFPAPSPEHTSPISPIQLGLLASNTPILRSLFCSLFSSSPPCLPTRCWLPFSFLHQALPPGATVHLPSHLSPNGLCLPTWHSTHMAQEFLPSLLPMPLSPIYAPISYLSPLSSRPSSMPPTPRAQPFPTMLDSAPSPSALCMHRATE